MTDDRHHRAPAQSGDQRARADSRDAHARRHPSRRGHRLDRPLEPFQDNPLFDSVAYGLPALAEGRWWTPITGTFFVNHPIVYAFVIPSFIGLAYLEHRRGSVVALAYFGIGQLFAIFASALFSGSPRCSRGRGRRQEALVLDVGPSGGTMAGIAAAVGLLAAPWRVRAWIVLLGFTVRHALLLGLARRPRARVRDRAHPLRRPVAAHPAHDRP